MKIILTGILILGLSFANGQGLQKISGYITDAVHNEPLEFATVYIPESKFYTETNAKGYFQILVPARNNYILKVSRLGYILQTISVKNTSDLILKIALQPIPSEEVVVTDKAQSKDNLIHEKVQSFELLPNASGNLESILPSIALGLRSSAGGELSSQYSVRGGSYDENLVFVNDFEIYRPQLIRNGQQEGLSFPNVNLIRDLSFSSGGFEAKFGDKQSSVLDIRYKVPEERKYSVEGSLLGGSAHAEGRFKLSPKRNFRYLIGARYKSNQYLLNSQPIEGEYVPRFFDIQSYLSYDISKNWQVSCIGNINTSRFNLIPESSAQARGSLLFGVLSLNTYYEGREVDYFNTAMAGVSILYFPKENKKKFFVKLNSSVQGSNEAEQFDISGYYRLVELEINNKDEEGKEVKLWGEGIQHRFARNYLNAMITNHEIRSGWQVNNSTHSLQQFWQAGFGLRSENLDDRINEWERIDSAGFSLPYQQGDSILLNEVIKSKNTLQNLKLFGWIQNSIEWNTGGKCKVFIVPGLRIHYNNLNNETILNPRFKIELAPKISVSDWRIWIASGLYHQPPLYRELRKIDGEINDKLLSQKSFHVVAGFKKDFLWKSVSAAKFRWISEFYYKSLWDQVSYDLDNVRIRYSGSNDSKAYAIGWDNRINGEFVPGAESWVNLSLLRTRERIDGLQHLTNQNAEGNVEKVSDVPRPTDQLFALSLFFQDYLPRNENFKMHVQTTIASGLPYGVEGQNRIYRNEYRFRPYNRVDLGFSFKLWDEEKRKRHPSGLLRFSKSTWVSLEVFNLLKIQNEASVRWIKSIYNYEFAIPNYLSSRRINLRLRMEF